MTTVPFARTRAGWTRDKVGLLASSADLQAEFVWPTDGRNVVWVWELRERVLDDLSTWQDPIEGFDVFRTATVQALTDLCDHLYGLPEDVAWRQHPDVLHEAVWVDIRQRASVVTALLDTDLDAYDARVGDMN